MGRTIYHGSEGNYTVKVEGSSEGVIGRVYFDGSKWKAESWRTAPHIYWCNEVQAMVRETQRVTTTIAGRYSRRGAAATALRAYRQRA